MQSIPDGRLGAEGYLSGYPGCFEKWSMPIQNWRLAMSRFIIEFGDRLNDHFNTVAITQNYGQARLVT